jgi:hypothetical protein
MALVVFHSKAAAEVFYFSADAYRLLEIAGKKPEPRGIFTTDQLADAIQRLEAAIAAEAALEQERAAAARDEDENDDEPDPDAAKKRVKLAQRAFPLLDMLRAARGKGVDVTWGV